MNNNARRARNVIGLTGALVVLAVGIPGGAAAVRNCGAVTWRTIRDGDQNCPRNHSVLADWTWTQLHWSVWGRMQATGEGVALHYTYRTVDERDRVVIHLTRPKDCDDGTRIYPRIDVTWYYASGPKNYGWRYYCNPQDSTSVGAGGG